MNILGRPATKFMRKLVPRGLLGRSLLIILTPLVVLQAVALQVFYGSHLQIVSRRLSDAVVGEIGYTIELLQRYPSPADQEWALRNARDRFHLDIDLDHHAQLVRRKDRNVLGPMDDDMRDSLRNQIGLPFTMDWTTDPQNILVRVQINEGVLSVSAPRKRLYASTIYLFVIWLVGTALLLFGIAALFMRNQVRAIRRLAVAAEAFGLGRDVGMIKPEGATEVRQAATAFNRMQERIRRFLAQRTEMLAGVSHDLRTPLTRLRLALAMIDGPAREDVAEMTGDIEEMERLISDYLAFARGEGTEQAEPTNLGAVLEEVAAGARRAGARIDLDVPGDLILKLRPNAVRRAITNLVDNARRHAKQVLVAAAAAGSRQVIVTIDDDGPGIPAALREAMFRPFETGAEGGAEGGNAGGTGLGLSIARDIVRAHGGDIMLEDSPLGGLRARVRLPV